MKTRIEIYKRTSKPWQMFAITSVIQNPWAGKFVEDLNPEIRTFGLILGSLLTELIVSLGGSGEAIEV